MKQTYQVKIAGLPLRVVTEEEEAYVNVLAQTLSGKINDIVMHNKSASKLDAALLCALDGMDREAKLRSMVKQLRADNTRLLEQLERLHKQGGNGGR